MNIGQKTVLALIRLYRKGVSPLFPGACRFHPTCSAYMAEAVAKKGLRKGLWMGCKRIVRCHPFNPGGYDPVE